MSPFPSYLFRVQTFTLLHQVIFNKYENGLKKNTHIEEGLMKNNFKINSKKNHIFYDKSF